MNIAICDDKKSEIKDLIKYIEKYPFEEPLHIEYFNLGSKLIEYLNEEKKFDIIFMDVMIGKNERGTNVSRFIKKSYPDTKMIFISFYANAKNTMDVANADPTGFLTKPLLQDDVNSVLRKVISELNASVKRFYLVSFKQVGYKVDLNEVKYATFNHRATRLMLKYGEFFPYKIYKKLDVFEDEVKRIHPHFVRIHKSYLVNLVYVTSFSHNKVFIGEEEIPVTPPYYESFRKSIEEYFEVDNFMLS